jgi:hypothetical protein
MYQRFILDVTIDMVWLKQGFDGREAATAPRFATPRPAGRGRDAFCSDADSGAGAPSLGG